MRKGPAEKSPHTVLAEGVVPTECRLEDDGLITVRLRKEALDAIAEAFDAQAVEFANWLKRERWRPLAWPDMSPELQEQRHQEALRAFQEGLQFATELRAVFRRFAYLALGRKVSGFMIKSGRYAVDVLPDMEQAPGLVEDDAPGRPLG
jgi:hypothetical protein